MKRRIVWMAVLAASVGSSAGAAPALNRPSDRLSDRAVARDQAAIAAVAARLAAYDTVTVPRLVYARTQGEGWLALARDQYDLNDESGLTEAAFEQAAAMATLLEANASSVPAPVPVAGSRRVREDLWQLSDSLKRSEALRCVAADLARLELTLVRAGHEAIRCRPDEPHPIARALDEDATRVRAKADECVIPVAIAPAPAPALPEAPPSAVPEQVTAALRRLGTLNNVHFDLNADTLSVASQAVLDSVSSVMRAVPEIRGTLIGHTDPRGSAAYNLALGRRRARAVFQYLVAAGVDSSRVTFGSQGKAAPVALGAGIREYALNRRVEILYAAPGGLHLEARHQEGDLQLERPKPASPPKKAVVRKPATAAKKP